MLKVSENKLLSTFFNYFSNLARLLFLCILESEVIEGLEAENLIEFLKGENRNLMVFADSESRKHVRKVANGLGVDFENYVRISILVFSFFYQNLNSFQFFDCYSTLA